MVNLHSRRLNLQFLHPILPIYIKCNFAKEFRPDKTIIIQKKTIVKGFGQGSPQNLNLFSKVRALPDSSLNLNTDFHGLKGFPQII